MTIYAYSDSARADYVTVDLALALDHSRRYYCPNKVCDAHLRIIQRQGNYRGYFGAKPSHPHNKGCSFASASCSKARKYDEQAFNFVDALQRLQHVGANVNPHIKTTGNGRTRDARHGLLLKPARTLRQIYSICKTFPPDKQYNSWFIRDMLFDNRSEDMYQHGPQDYMLVEAIRYKFFYKSDSQILYLRTNTKQRYQLHIHVPDEKIYKQMRKLLYNNSNSTIVVAGLWKLNTNQAVSSLEINSKRQYMLLH